MNLHHSPGGSHIEKNRTKNTKLSVFDLRRYDCLDTLTKPFRKLKSLTKMVIKKTKSELQILFWMRPFAVTPSDSSQDFNF